MRPTIISLAVAFLAAAQAFAAPIQWKIEDGGNGHFYEVVLADQPVSYVGDSDYSGGVTWTDARDAATAKGGWLVDITSAEENAFVEGLVVPGQHPEYWFTEKGPYPCQMGPWIGGFQPTGSPEPAGNWKWVTGESFMDAGGSPTQYNDWYWDQPGNHCPQLGGIPEDALHLYYRPYEHRPVGWNDYPSSTVTNGYIIESVPEPSTLVLLSLALLSLIYARRRK